jgi:hypothetical protein
VEDEAVTEDTRPDLDQSRRNILRKMAYIPPAVFTLSAMPFAAAYGSGTPDWAPPAEPPCKTRWRGQRNVLDGSVNNRRRASSNHWSFLRKKL